uniref:Uncharacterized protein n=1 Tax=Arundo donax TaxID=35708 RepID=A0A0A9F2P9_ARUDO
MFTFLTYCADKWWFVFFLLYKMLTNPVHRNARCLNLCLKRQLLSSQFGEFRKHKRRRSEND